MTYCMNSIVFKDDTILENNIVRNKQHKEYWCRYICLIYTYLVSQQYDDFFVVEVTEEGDHITKIDLLMNSQPTKDFKHYMTKAFRIYLYTIPLYYKNIYFNRLRIFMNGVEVLFV